MGKRSSQPKSPEPSQRQLRAGELIRHALVGILAREEFRDPVLQGISLTIGEVRCSPDLRHANVYCIPLGDQDAERAKSVAEALNRAANFLRGRLGREIDMKFTPQLHFIPDESYDSALAMSNLLAAARRRDRDFADEGEPEASDTVSKTIE